MFLKIFNILLKLVIQCPLNFYQSRHNNFGDGDLAGLLDMDGMAGRFSEDPLGDLAGDMDLFGVVGLDILFGGSKKEAST